MTGLSCQLLCDEQPDVLLPSHGSPMRDPQAALVLLAGRMQRVVDARSPLPWQLETYLREPYEPVTSVDEQVEQRLFLCVAVGDR
jgi:hypothetical protein